jgi:signal transduction histidine kinase/CheY-like chemotaxis protein
MKIVVGVCFFFSFLFGHYVDGKLDEEDLQYIKNHKVVKVCVNPDWAPIEFRENRVPKGISIDILKLISKKVGFKLKFIDTKSWVESQLFLKEGVCDITPTAIKTEKREKYAIFTRPYLNYDLAIITRYDKPYITNLEAILDRTISRKKGSGLISKLRKLSSKVKIVEANSLLEMFKIVDNGEVYATIATLPVFAYYKKKYHFDNLKIAGFSGMNYPLRIMVNKNYPKLQHILDSELKFIKPEVTQKIYEKWIIKTKPTIDYQKLLTLTAIILLGLLFAILISYYLYKQNKKLKYLSEVKSQFLANISHEIKTPLNAILGFITIIEEDSSKCLNYIPIVEISAKSLLSLIKDILNFSKLEKSGIKVEKQEFCRRELLGVTKIYQFGAEKKGITFKVETFNLPEIMFGDFNKITDVIIHLLDNAVKFTPQNGKIKVTFQFYRGKLLFKVKDNGIGIDKAKEDKIFEPFVQLDNRVNKEYKGLGIGLAIAKKLVSFLGGELKYKPVKGGGSEFCFEIPIETEESSKNFEEDSAIKRCKKQDYQNSKPEKVLIVEDNKANQLFMKVLLKKFNVDFDVAENGKEAVEFYKKYHYPLILMDINMPVMDGFEATKLIREYEKRENLPASKIVAITATSIDEYKDRFRDIGIDCIIPKPVDIEKLQVIFR